jgi:hypothetical protein
VNPIKTQGNASSGCLESQKNRRKTEKSNGSRSRTLPLRGKVRSTATDGDLRSWAPTNVGGRRVSRPTGLVRDSSLWIEYGPRDCGSCREAQNAAQDIRRIFAAHQRRLPGSSEIFAQFAVDGGLAVSFSVMSRMLAVTSPRAPASISSVLAFAATAVSRLLRRASSSDCSAAT